MCRVLGAGSVPVSKMILAPILLGFFDFHRRREFMNLLAFMAAAKARLRFAS